MRWAYYLLLWSDGSIDAEDSRDLETERLQLKRKTIDKRENLANKLYQNIKKV